MWKIRTIIIKLDCTTTIQYSTAQYPRCQKGFATIMCNRIICIRCILRKIAQEWIAQENYTILYYKYVELIHLLCSSSRREREFFSFCLFGVSDNTKWYIWQASELRIVHRRNILLRASIQTNTLQWMNESANSSRMAHSSFMILKYEFRDGPFWHCQFIFFFSSIFRVTAGWGAYWET